MDVRRSLTAALTAAFALALACPAHAHADDGPVLDGDGTSVSFEMPSPGGTAEWTMRVRAAGAPAAPLPLSLVLVEAAGSATTGPHPLRLSLADEDGGELASGEAAALVGRVLELAPLPPGRERTVAVRAELPAEAGDEYRGAQADLRFRFAAERPDPGAAGSRGAAPDDERGGADGAADAGGRRLGAGRGGPADLAVSGADVLAPVLVAGALAATGLTIVVATVRRRDDEPPSGARRPGPEGTTERGGPACDRTGEERDG